MARNVLNMQTGSTAVAALLKSPWAIALYMSLKMIDFELGCRAIVHATVSRIREDLTSQEVDV